jgi:hypothetical protein
MVWGMPHHMVRNLLRVAPLLALVALPATADAATAASGRVVSCSTYADFPNVKISSARGMTCAAARSDMKAYRGEIKRSFKTPGGFTCRQVSGVAEGGQWRCTSGSRAYRFEFKD